MTDVSDQPITGAATSRRMLPIAGAPVSFGVYNLADTRGPGAPTAEHILDALQDAGYEGVDLGPVGLFGRGAELRERLGSRGLSLAGGWFDLPFEDDEAFAAAMPAFDDALEVFADAATLNPEHPPLPTLACSSTPEREAHPGGAPGIGLTEVEWDTLAHNVQIAAARVADIGLEPTFHHHACTHVETVAEVDAFLSRTDIGLTFDTGHAILGGGDPTAELLRWQHRINHIHLKDARIDVLRGVIADGGGMAEVWASGAFVPLGAGDLDVELFMSQLEQIGYSGWLVIEQDTMPSATYTFDDMRRDQRINREAIRKWYP